tara:strand:+ start:495 stop:881 length:387 start_codon:yes stop_codon:yes gene_type:complete
MTNLEEEEKNKTCPYCGKAKSLNQYYKVSKNKDGKDSYCKLCRNNFNKPPGRRDPRPVPKMLKPKINAFDLIYKTKKWNSLGTHNKYDSAELDFLIYNDLDITEAFNMNTQERDEKKKHKKHKTQWKR